MERDKVLNVVIDLEKYIVARNYNGYDPYDALMSPVFKLLSFDSKILRIFFTQFLKRSPINLRKLVGIEHHRSPKAIALMVGGYVDLYKLTNNTVWINKAELLANWLIENQCTGYSGSCWGYEFDWQSRAFFVKKNTPSSVVTSFVIHSLIDLYEVTGNEKMMETLISSSNFYLNDLNKTYNGNSFCFSYTPIDTLMVHNANLLCSGTLSRIQKVNKSVSFLDYIENSTNFSLDKQQYSGAWYYGEKEYQKWIDSFHTAYNLSSLESIKKVYKSNKIQQSIEKGKAYYINNFFLSDGTPKYYHNNKFPIDIHCPTVAIKYFSENKSNKELVQKIVLNLLDNYFDYNKKYFYCGQKAYFIKNKISYMRWSQAWAFNSLVKYLVGFKN